MEPPRGLGLERPIAVQFHHLDRDDLLLDEGVEDEVVLALHEVAFAGNVDVVLHTAVTLPLWGEPLEGFRAYGGLPQCPTHLEQNKQGYRQQDALLDVSLHGATPFVRGLLQDTPDENTAGGDRTS